MKSPTPIITTCILLLMMMLMFSCAQDESYSALPCIDTNCADYTSLIDAQNAFNADPDCRGDLDADNDGIACEEPGNSVTSCPTTSSCGCSNLNKTPCQANVCCRWIVGSGCDCK